MSRYIVQSNGLYKQDLVELIELGLASKMNITREKVQGLMWSDCYIMAGEFNGISIMYDEKEKEFVAGDGGLYVGCGDTELEALQNYLEDKERFLKGE